MRRCVSASRPTAEIRAASTEDMHSESRHINRHHYVLCRLHTHTHPACLSPPPCAPTFAQREIVHRSLIAGALQVRHSNPPPDGTSHKWRQSDGAAPRCCRAQTTQPDPQPEPRATSQAARYPSSGDPGLSLTMRLGRRAIGSSLLRAFSPGLRQATSHLKLVQLYWQPSTAALVQIGCRMVDVKRHAQSQICDR